MNITDQNFNEKVIEQSKDKLVIADFWAEWCAPCNMLAPILDKVVESFEGKVLLAKINTDTCTEKSNEFKINAIPSVKFFKNGKVIDEFVGVQSEETIKEKIESALK